ncbi:hypothetical protein [Burkholderia sp. F1]|uniref:hypothetical protein n=1 Tax=Burkholderia sp. F1 TaxID=3366817 RepID=UPI003D748C16
MTNLPGYVFLLSTDKQQLQRDRLELRALGLDIGMFHMEFIHTEQGPRQIEVNLRIAGGTIPDLALPEAS